MNDSKIKVLLVEPEKYPKEIVIDDSLEAMQEVVGGDIEEYMPFDDDVAIICNEEGKMRGLPLNRAVYVQDNDKKEMVDIICGKFFICYEKVLYRMRHNKYDSLRKSYNKVIKNKVNDVKQGLYQTIYLTLTIMAEDVADAKAHLVLWRVP